MLGHERFKAAGDREHIESEQPCGCARCERDEMEREVVAKAAVRRERKQGDRDAIRKLECARVVGTV